MRRAIYPGTFDPVTNGHLDIIERASKLFDEIVIGVLVNSDKAPMFSVDERKTFLHEIIPTVKLGECKIVIEDFKGLLVDFAAKKSASAIIRGIRAISDYEYELQMALMNRKLKPQIETVFLMSSEAYSFISSRLVKEVCRLGGSVTGFVPQLIERKMREKIARS
jgi:pantetheine-phosphate adenylyltransferase